MEHSLEPYQFPVGHDGGGVGMGRATKVFLRIPSHAKKSMRDERSKVLPSYQGCMGGREREKFYWSAITHTQLRLPRGWPGSPFKVCVEWGLTLSFASREEKTEVRPMAIGSCIYQFSQAGGGVNSFSEGFHQAPHIRGNFPLKSGGRWGLGGRDPTLVGSLFTYLDAKGGKLTKEKENKKISHKIIFQPVLDMQKLVGGRKKI